MCIMSSLDVLHYVLSAAIILIALVVVGVGIALVLFLEEAKKALQLVGHVGESMQHGMIGSVISFGRNLFTKKPHHG